MVSELDFDDRDLGFNSLRSYGLLPDLIIKGECFWKLSMHLQKRREGFKQEVGQEFDVESWVGQGSKI